MAASDKSDKLFGLMQKHAPGIINDVPYAKALGFELTRLERGRAFAKAPYNEALIGDPETGVIHGGVLTALLDNICGVAVVSSLTELRSTATLDLRIDYMRPAERGRDIIGEAECYHVTRTVAFTRAWAYHDTRDRVIATATGAFALTDLGGLSKMAGATRAAKS